jgi:hypothetical protein
MVYLLKKGIMINITKAIKGASFTVWDDKIRGNSHWETKPPILLDSSGDNEKFLQTLYVHVMKNGYNNN